MSKKLILTVLSLILGLCAIQAQTSGIHGTVVDQEGAPVIGAGVFQTGNESNGTVTDLDGKFTLKVPSGASITVRSLGFSDQTVLAQETMEIALQPDTDFLDEVVVVGYGVQRKSNLTGAISTVSSKDIEGRTITNLSQALQGKTAGVNLVATSAQPGAVPTVRIRGIASNGTSDPLYVVDGLITDDISGIDPNSIEGMEVLKDAASAAIYGAQAGNGVILITTKRGDKGNSSIVYDYQLALSTLARKPEVLTSSDYFTQHAEKSVTFNDDNILQYIEQGVWDGKSSTDWFSEVFTTSPTQRHTVTMQGANDKGSLYVSLSSLDEDGIVKMKRDYYKRISAVVNADYQVKPWMKVGLTADFADYSCGPVEDAQSTHGAGFYLNIFGSAVTMPPFERPTYSPDQLPSIMQMALANGFQLFKDENGDYISAVSSPNPLATMMAREMKNYGDILSGTLYANFTPIKGLTITSRLGYKFSNVNTYVFNHKAFLCPMIQIVDTGASRTSSTNNYYQWENFANYSKSFGKHNLSAMVGMSYSQNYLTYLGERITNTIEDSETFADISYASSESGKTLVGYSLTNRKLSYFGRLSYDYDGKYLAEVIFRADSADSSILPPTNRTGRFPSFSAGWVISNENFFKDLSLPISFLKLRGSWGRNGSTSNLGGYSYSNSIYIEAPGYSYSNEGITYQQVAYPTQLYNPDLKWETSQQLDLGVDLRVFDNRLSASFDYFDKQTRDLIINKVNVPYEAGNVAAPVNAGNIANRGIEIDLGWKDTKGDFFYSISGNIATLSNKVTYLDPNVGDGRIYGSTLSNGIFATAFEKGYPVWYFRGYRVLGYDDIGAPIFENVDDSDDIINDNDRVMIGKPLPDLSYGITLTLGWKGLDFTVFGNGTRGNDVLNAYNVTSISYSLKPMFDQRWTEANPGKAKFAKPSPNNYDKYIISDDMIFDGSYFRIKQIQLGYTLPSNITRKFFVEKLRVYSSVDNAFLFTSYPGIDPEVATNTISGIGIDFGCYPTTRKVVFGVNVTF